MRKLMIEVRFFFKQHDFFIASLWAPCVDAALAAGNVAYVKERKTLKKCSNAKKKNNTIRVAVEFLAD